MRAKLFVVMISIAFVLCSCGNSISQEEYDNVVSERNELQEKLDDIEKSNSLKEKVAEYKAAAKAEYKAQKSFYEFIATMTGSDLSDSIQQMDALYQKYIESIDAVTKSGIIDTDTAEESIDKFHNSWNDAVSTYYDALPDLAQNLKVVYSGNTSNNKASTSSDKSTPEKGIGTLVYEDSSVKIYYIGLTNRGVVFKVDNLTDKNIVIQADSISINRESINSIIMSDDVAPQSIGEVVAKCDVSGFSNVETIGGQLRVIDSNDFTKTSRVTFVNVAVE